MCHTQVGLALAVARGVAPADSVSIALDTHVTKIKVPTAPSTGLLMVGTASK